MASKKARELAARQKAEVKAAKQAKKNSTDPRDWNWFRQVVHTYKITTEVDPQAKWLIPLTVAGVTVLVAVLGGILLPGVWWMWLLTGLMAGLVAGLYLLVDRAKKGTYKRYAGQPGAGEVALSMLDNKKWAYTAGITATRQLDVVHRAIGPAGIVLIGEGSPARLKTLLAAEARKHEQVAYGVAVTTVIMGDGEGQVPLDKLAAYLKKLPKAMEPGQSTEVRQRLRALDAVRPKVPIPKGPMPNLKGVNRAMRGR
jgi:hypothetical protein